MAHAKNTFALILIFTLFFVAQCHKVTSARPPASTPTPTPGPTSDEEASSSEEEASSPEPEEEDDSSEEEASSPTEDSSSSDEGKLKTSGDASSPEKEEEKEDDDASSSDEEKPSSGEDTSSAPLSEPAADSPMSLRELFEISLPDIGLKKAQVALNPEGAKVTNKQLEGIEHKIDEFKIILTKRQADPKASEPAKKCLTQCQENLDDAAEGVKQSIESINNQDLDKSINDIGSISTDVETCNDCFIELEGEDKEVNAFADWVKGVIKECLVNIKKT